VISLFLIAGSLILTAVSLRRTRRIHVNIRRRQLKLSGIYAGMQKIPANEVSRHANQAGYHG